MKSLCLHLLTPLLLTVACIAQETPDWELYGGFQFTHYHTAQLQEVVNSLVAETGPAGLRINSRPNMIGWNFSAQQNVNSWFGGIVDFSGGYGSKNVTLPQAPGTRIAPTFKPTIFTMGGGPQFSYRRNEHIQPFFRMICAAAYANLNPDRTTTSQLNSMYPPPSTSETAFALIFGGGVDYRLTNDTSLRVAGDYLHTFVFNESESNFRITAGITFRIGSR